MRTEIRNSEFQQKAPFYYNLDAILSVGFRARSKQGTLFRQWAIERLRNYIVKGFDIDSERLKGNGGGQYWYELLNTIKEGQKDWYKMPRLFKAGQTYLSL